MSVHRLSMRVLAAFCTAVVLLCILWSARYFPLLPRGLLSRNDWAVLAQSRPGQGSDDLLDDASNATLGFQKIFIVNLPSRTDRRDSGSLAAALTGLQVEFVDAVTQVDAKALPLGAEESNLNAGSVGAWRSHMDVVRRIVEQNISSALILEDDADWDVRIASQMRDFARASRLLVQPLPGYHDRYLDPTWPRPDDRSQDYVDIDIHSPCPTEPTTSPYGDLCRWDVLWLGHCGCHFPNPSDHNIPLGRVPLFNDSTVPARHHVNVEFGDSSLLDQYPDHTRVVGRSHAMTCSLAYALSQHGARTLLYDLAVRRLTAPFDVMLSSLCQPSNNTLLATCLSPQPALFNHFRPVGLRSSWSNIVDSDHQGWNDVASSTNLRWATRVNLPNLIQGGKDLVDLYPDEEGIKRE